MIRTEQIIQQAAWRRTDLFAALDELVSFAKGDFVRELFDEALFWIFLLIASTRTAKATPVPPRH